VYAGFNGSVARNRTLLPNRPMGLAKMAPGADQRAHTSTCSVRLLGALGQLYRNQETFDTEACAHTLRFMPVWAMMFRFRGKVGPPSFPGCRAVGMLKPKGTLWKELCLWTRPQVVPKLSKPAIRNLSHSYIMMRGRVLRSDPSRSMPMLAVRG
jgi:hypothetical protein